MARVESDSTSIELKYDKALRGKEITMHDIRFFFISMHDIR